MSRKMLLGLLLFIWFTAYTTVEALATCSYDLNGVGYGSDGEDCPYRGGGSGGGVGGGDADDYYRNQAREERAQREEAERRAREQREAEELQRLATANTQNDQGLAAWKNKDWPTAIGYFELALQNNPDSQIIKDNLAGARQRLQRQQDEKTAVANMRQIVQNVKFTPAPTPSGLDFKGEGIAQKSGGKGALDFNSFSTAKSQPPKPKIGPAGDPGEHQVTTGLFGTKVAKPVLAPADRPARVGTDTKAIDQLVTAANTDSDLAIIYDIGGAQKTGRLLDAPAADLDPTRFSERARKDPLIMQTVQELATLAARQSRLHTAREDLARKRNSASTQATMNQLDQKWTRVNQEFQNTVTEIAKKTELVKKQRRCIDTAVGNSTTCQNGQATMRPAKP